MYIIVVSLLLLFYVTYLYLFLVRSTFYVFKIIILNFPFPLFVTTIILIIIQTTDIRTDISKVLKMNLIKKSKIHCVYLDKWSTIAFRKILEIIKDNQELSKEFNSWACNQKQPIKLHVFTSPSTWESLLVPLTHIKVTRFGETLQRWKEGIIWPALDLNHFQKTKQLTSSPARQGCTLCTLWSRDILWHNQESV